MQRGISLVELNFRCIRVYDDDPDGIAIVEAGGVTDPQANPLPHLCLGNEVVWASGGCQC